MKLEVRLSKETSKDSFLPFTRQLFQSKYISNIYNSVFTHFLNTFNYKKHKAQIAYNLIFHKTHNRFFCSLSLVFDKSTKLIVYKQQI